MPITKQALHGTEITPHLEAIAKLRVNIFCEYPYLYKGTQEYEKEYLAGYAASTHSVIILGWDGEKLAGAITAIPMQAETEEFKAAFKGSPYNIEELFYVGELLFYPAYRSQGLGTELIIQAEQHAKNINKYKHITCAHVVRPKDHPAKPQNFKPIDHFLLRNNYFKLDDIVTSFEWPELDGKSLDHPMQFWLKNLD